MQNHFPGFLPSTYIRLAQFPIYWNSFANEQNLQPYVTEKVTSLRDIFGIQQLNDSAYVSDCILFAGVFSSQVKRRKRKNQSAV